MSNSKPSFDIKNKGMITLCIMLATIMEIIDMTIANVALPHMQGSLNATQDQITWVLTSYIVASGIAMPVSGFLAGKFGIRKLMIICTAGFTVASVLCGFATSLGQIVFFRLAQGIFGAALVPISQAILFSINPPEKHGEAMAMWGVGIMVAPIMGPVLGGYITEYYNWRWIFFINLPVGLLAVLGMWKYLTIENKTSAKFDTTGFVLFLIFISALQLILDRGEQLDWFESTEIKLYFWTFILFFATFLWWIIRKYDAFIPVQLFKDRNFAVSTIIMFCVGLILFSSITLLPLFLQSIIGYNVLDTGILTVPRGVGALFSMMLVGSILMKKVDIRVLVLFGLAMVGASNYMMTAFSQNVTFEMICISGVIQGFGIGFLFVPLSTTAFTTLTDETRSQASAIFSLIRTIGGAIGVSSIIAFVAKQTKIHHAYFAEFINSSSSALNQYQNIFPQSNQVLKAIALDGIVSNQAAMVAYLDSFMVSSIFTLIVVPLVFLLKPIKNFHSTEIGH